MGASLLALVRSILMALKKKLKKFDGFRLKNTKEYLIQDYV